ncbi:MAG: hypothetical protein EPN26_17030 [Rhodospirillales bacterium]|nr:MAG: hypothetical protein EPN26_17030 [Rhodospirillales bacterium]
MKHFLFVLLFAQIATAPAWAGEEKPIYPKGSRFEYTYAKRKTGGEVEVELKSFAAKCLEQHPEAQLYTAYEEGYPLPTAVECRFDQAGHDAVTVQWLHSTGACKSEPTSGETYAGCSAPKMYRQKFYPTLLQRTN